MGLKNIKSCVTRLIEITSPYALSLDSSSSNSQLPRDRFPGGDPPAHLHCITIKEYLLILMISLYHLFLS